MVDNPELPNPAENPSGDSEHLEGRPYSHSTYTNHGCRCERCRAFANEWARDWTRKNQDHLRQYRREATARLKGTPVPEGLAHTHYTYSTYGCRCDVCREANNAKNRKYYRRKKAGEA